MRVLQGRARGKHKVELMGVAGLERGQALSMEPANLERHKRSHHE